ncbi:hypothetical protein K458DRAFT_390975 [Lentithecium fluviatile CBS 122367]|uniref:Uncharacterized protein n=1 Tax=Lentithecium fluviatile CBS 122367 TaxID=1168545 RepID=A0A6G1IX78_9PLEO|nr:hypothetical protein K458DRAFT_390975 [Lentithecium fluviatile CBS 122367]
MDESSDLTPGMVGQTRETWALKYQTAFGLRFVVVALHAKCRHLRMRPCSSVDQAQLISATGVDELWQSAYSTGHLRLEGELINVSSFRTGVGTSLIPYHYLVDLKAKMEEAENEALTTAQAVRKRAIGALEFRYRQNEAVAMWTSRPAPSPHTRGYEIWYPDYGAVFPKESSSLPLC